MVGLNEAGLRIGGMFLMNILSFTGSSIDPRLLDSWQTVVVDYLLSLFSCFSNYASQFIQPAFPWPRKENAVGDSAKILNKAVCIFTYFLSVCVYLFSFILLARYFLIEGSCIP